jgi:tetratricopeptide (TPR) repeat protein
VSSPDELARLVEHARALAARHQWKEAQVELLKVVKVDRNNKAGFCLLGEVLLRRGDYERALPVLQHAQNLEPSNPAVLSMLRKARAGQPLDPPPPIPTAQATKKAPPPRSQTDLDEGPTRVDDRDRAGITRSSDDSRNPLRGNVQEEVTGEIADEPTRSPVGSHKAKGVPPAPAANPAESLRKSPRPSAPPPMGQVAQAAAQMQARRSEAPPPPAAPAVRPRVIGGAKQVNPAAEALRQSAAAGENYLNDLLTGGLLEVPGVRVPDSEFDIRPDRRWGRSAGRMFTALFVLLVLGAGGGVAWWYYSEQAKAEAVKKHRAAAAALLPSGSFDDLMGAAGQLGKALERDRKNTRTFAQVAEVTALQTLLYGFPAMNANDAIAAAARDIDKPEEEGYRELVIARTAVALATLATESDADASLAKARATIDEWLTAHTDDRWARWLQARAMLAAGERAAARGGFQAAAEGDDGLIPAMIDLADLLVDDGKFEEAMALYARALEAEPGHPLALVGQVVAWAERGAEKDKALGMLNVELPEKKNYGPRVRAYRQLALGLAKYQIEEFEAFDKALTQAIDDGPPEPRYLGRVALARLLAGDFPAGVRARGAIAWFGKGKPESDPVVTLFDATLLVESGLPARALDVLGGLEGTRAHIIRAQALIDLGATDKGKLSEAVKEAEAALAGAPENAEAQALAAWARVLEATGSERDKLIKGDLNKIANAMVSKRGRHAEGAALYGVGSGEARQKLEQALANIDVANPNPIAYRTHTLLARLDLAEGKLPEAGKHVEDALAANGGYLPAMIVKAKIFLAGGDAETALAALGPVLTEPEAITWEVELAHAEALAAREGTTEADRVEATEAVKRAKQMGAPPSELGRIAALINPDLPDALGVPAPQTAEEAEKQDKKKKGRRR